MSEKPRFGFVVEYVKDIEASKRFYVDVLGLKVEREHPSYVQFETFAIASDEPVGGEAGEEVFWIVDDAESSFSSLQQKAEICLPMKQVPFGKVFGVRDLDGRPRYILEFAKDRPSHVV